MTTGLDPAARRVAWDLVRRGARHGHHRRARDPFHGGGRAALRPHRGDGCGTHRRRRPSASSWSPTTPGTSRWCSPPTLRTSPGWPRCRDVDTVTRHGARVEVRGSGAVLAHVAAALVGARHHAARPARRAAHARGRLPDAHRPRDGGVMRGPPQDDLDRDQAAGARAGDAGLLVRLPHPGARACWAGSSATRRMKQGSLRGRQDDGLVRAQLHRAGDRVDRHDLVAGAPVVVSRARRAAPLPRQRRLGSGAARLAAPRQPRRGVSIGALIITILGMARVRRRGCRSSPAEVALAYVVGRVLLRRHRRAARLAGAARRARRSRSGLLLWFVMLFVSGTSAPLDRLPSWMVAIGKALPLYHSVMALVDPWIGRGTNWTQLAHRRRRRRRGDAW